MVYREAHWRVRDATTHDVIERSAYGDTSEIARARLLKAAKSFGYTEVELELVSTIDLQKENPDV